MPRNVADARAELDEARATLTALEESVREGEDVTAQQLAAQRELISFAELRVEAAQRTEARMREDERAELAATAKTAATDLITGDTMPSIATATKTAVDALAALATLAYERNAKIEELGATLAGIDEDLKVQLDADPWASKRYGIWGARDRVNVPGTGFAARMDVGALTTAVVAIALAGSPQGRDAARSHRDHANGLANLTVRKLLEDFPPLGVELRATPEEFAAADQRGQAELFEQGRRPLPDEG
ncbi:MULTISPECIES: hypothetical protein [unclassified Streptomyces]|uniref:hypothetical protein n=1 Tax=unclassified Streptomyces TaxID=2593676 RepID=UPI0033DC3751